MRALVVVLAILAGMKIWVHDTLFRAASEQALLKAYAHHAVVACQQTKALPSHANRSKYKRADWSQYKLAKVVMGDQTIDVSLWQVDHKLWDERYKTPYIHLNIGETSANHLCTYNILTGAALVRHT